MWEEVVVSGIPHDLTSGETEVEASVRQRYVEEDEMRILQTQWNLI